MRMRFRTFLALSITLIFLPVLIHAQTVGVQDITSAGTLLYTTPPTPGPGQNYTASLESSSVDLDSGTIIWTVNGKQVQKGQGIKSLSLTNGPLGSKTVIGVTVNSSNGNVTKSLTLQPASVDLLWQGRGYTPPFYKGRTAWTNQGQITFYAVASVLGSSGTKVNPSNLVYRWSKDGTVLGASSGAGKSIITLSDSVLSLPENISVDIMTDQSTVVATQSINLTPFAPSVLVYEDNPLYGILFNNEAGGGMSVSNQQEFSFVALPLFFSSMNKDASNVGYSWSTNNTAGNQTTSMVTYRSPNQNSGSSNISVQINSKTSLLQTANKSFIVNFSGQSNI
jgi:hypothetical protein